MSTPSVSPASGKGNIQDRFQRLASDWKEQSRYLSNSAQMAMLKPYQRIIGMGWPVVPLMQNIKIHQRDKKPEHDTYEEGPTTTKDLDCCKKIIAYVKTFNEKSTLKYDALCCNSNTALRCMFKACDIVYMFQPADEKPTGWDCPQPTGSAVPPFEKPAPCPGL